METNPIEGRITDFDRSSLIMMALSYFIYILLAPFLLFMGLFGKKARLFSHLCSRYIGKYLARVTISSHKGMRFRRIVTVKNLPPQYIIIANHLSRLDLVYSASVFAKPTYIGKTEIRQSILGLPAILSGSIFVKREEKDSRKAALEALQKKAAQGVSLGIFPEGASNKTDGNLKELKIGAFKIAKEFNIPLVLAAIHDYPGLDNKREVAIEVFDILNPEQFTSPEEIRDLAAEKIKERLEIQRQAIEKLLQTQQLGQSSLQQSNSAQQSLEIV